MVIVEVLQMAQVGHCSFYVGVKVGSAVTRHLEIVGRGPRRCPQPDGVAAAPGDIDLQAVDRSGAHHLGEIIKAVAVLPGGHVGATGITDLPQPIEVIGGHRLFEPDNVVLVVELLAHPYRLFAGVATIGVYVQFHVVADDLPGQRHPGQVPSGVIAPRLADLDLDPGIPQPLVHCSSWARVLGSS